MTFTLRWTPEDLWAAHWLILKKRQFALFVLPALLILGCAMVGLSIFLISRDEKISGLIFLGWSLFLVIGSAFYRPWRLRQFRKIPESDLCVDVSLSSEGLRAKRTDAESFVKWGVFKDWCEDEHIIMLIRKDKSLSTMFPKRQLNADQLQELKELLTEKVGLKP